MSISKIRSIIILFLLLTLLIWGLFFLFSIRFSKGDIYPAYSSLRADPLGTKVLFKVLRNVNPGKVLRNISPLMQRDSREKGTFLFLGVKSNAFYHVSKSEADFFQKMLQSGDRLVIAYRPISMAYCSAKKKLKSQKCSPNKQSKEKKGKEITKKQAEKENFKDKKKKKSDTIKKKTEKTMKKLAFGGNWIDLTTKWGFSLKTKAYPNTKQNSVLVKLSEVKEEQEKSLPKTLLWHSVSVFTKYDEKWTPIYMRGKDAVVMERRFSKGSLVLASDSYLFSNEALARDRQVPFLLWITQNRAANDIIVFDETHLGLQQSPGIATLLIKYRLSGLLLVLSICALLYVWKNLSSFMPAFHYNNSEEMVVASEERNTMSGFINLLKRNISENEILKVCYYEWQKTLPLRLKRIAEQRKALILDVIKNESEQSKKTAAKNTSAAYRKICQILEKRRFISD